MGAGSLVRDSRTVVKPVPKLYISQTIKSWLLFNEIVIFTLLYTEEHFWREK